MPDPFKLFYRLMLAAMKIFGYTLTSAAQAGWYAAHGRRDLMGQVIGDLGRGITDALAKVLGD